MPDIPALEFQGTKQLWKHPPVMGLIGALENHPNGVLVGRAGVLDLLEKGF